MSNKYYDGSEKKPCEKNSKTLKSKVRKCAKDAGVLASIGVLVASTAKLVEKLTKK